MFYLFFCIFIAVVLSAYLICKFCIKNKDQFHTVITKILKISVVVYCVISLLSILLPDALYLCYDAEDVVNSPLTGVAIVKWIGSVAFIMLPLAVFFKNRTIRNIAIYFCTIATVLQLVFYPQFLECFTSLNGRGINSISVVSDSVKAFFINPVFRSCVIGFVWGIELLIPIILAIEEKHVFNFKNAKEYGWFFLVLALSLISSLPIYVPQHLFGYSNIIFEAWSIPHIIWVVLVIVEIIVLYFIFRNKNTEHKMLMLFILSLSLVMQYSQMFGAIGIDIKRLPLQLCNIGSFLILFALITKSKKIFDFTVIVNVVGVIFALAVPDLDGEGLFYLYNIHFIFEHTNVIVIPILALLLGIFPKLDKSSLKHFMVGFVIYFVVVFVLGSVFNAVGKSTGNGFWSANYLFMFDPVVAGDLAPFFGSLFDTKLVVGNFTFYPVAQTLVFIGFTAICLIVFGLIQLIYFIKGKIEKKNTNKDLIA